MLLPPEDWEVIVVDNDSSDGSAEMVREEFSAATLIANKENLGFGKANNQAFRVSKGKYILLLNPDTIVIEHALDSMLSMMDSRPDIGALGCRLLNTDESFQRWTGGSPPDLLNITCHFLFAYRLLPARLLPRPLYLEGEPTEDTEVGWVSGACMLLRREALDAQIFDERFFLYGEDLDLCDRLARQGWKVVYTPKARIIHHEGRSLDGQTYDVQMSKLRSLRDIFAVRHNRSSLMYYDFVVSAGFLMRLVAYRVAAVARPNRGFDHRAMWCRRFLSEAVNTLVNRRV